MGFIMAIMLSSIPFFPELKRWIDYRETWMVSVSQSSFQETAYQVMLGFPLFLVAFFCYWYLSKLPVAILLPICVALAVSFVSLIVFRCMEV